MSENIQNASPQWSNTTKLVVGLSFVAIFAVLVSQFRSLIGPLLLTFILSYLLYPLASWLRNRFKISWGLAVGLIYLIVLLSLGGLLIWGGITIVDQIGSLVDFLQTAVDDLPEWLEQANRWSFTFGGFTFSMENLDLASLGNELLGLIQPMFTRAGSMVGTIATGAVTTIGWMLFVLMVSYFILSETKGTSERIIKLQIPGYHEDLKCLGRELSRIWNAFLRGQLILMILTMVVFTIFLGVLGVRYAIGLALLAGLARFVPYIGSWIAWITYFLVALLQGTTPFGLQPFTFALVVVGVGVLIDTIIDNFVVPRLYANALRVHPAAVLVAILVSASLLGIIGVMLAAPVLATLMLFFQYAVLKMLDKDPWETIKVEPTPLPSIHVFDPIVSQWRKIQRFSREKISKIREKNSQ